MNSEELESRDPQFVNLFQKLVSTFEGQDEGLSQALNLMAIVLTPPDPSQPAPISIEEAQQRRRNTVGENEPMEFDYSDTQKAAILALFQYKAGHEVDLELATHLIERYSPEMRGGRRRRYRKSRKSHKRRKSSKRPKSRRS